jgi:hypothetical protein
MVRPRGARRFVDLGDAVLHQCIRSLIGAYRGSRPSWISARVRSRYRTGLNGPFGSPVFARAGKTDPPFRLILSQTSAGNAVRCVIDRSSFEPFLCSCLAAVSFVPACAHAGAPRARGRQRLAVALVLALAPLLPGHALTGPSTARWSNWLGRHLIHLNALEGAPLVENCPGDAGELVRERDRQHVVVEALSCGLDPRLEPIPLPLLS